MRAAVAVALVAGCGRFGFGELGGPGSDATGGDTTATTDGGIRKTLRLDRVAPAATLTGYILPIILDDSRIDRTQLEANAADLEFFDSTGADLDLEIEQVGAAGGPPLVAWIKVPTISGLTTTIDMRYGTPRDVPRRSPYDDTYDGVYHFANGEGRDSSGTHAATNMGAVVTPGLLGDGIALGGSQYMVVPTTTTIAASGSFTLEGWIEMTSLPAAYYALMSREVGTTSDDDIYLGVQGSQALCTCEQTNAEYDALGGTVTAGNWVYVAGTATSTEVKVFIEGVMAAQTAVPGALQHGTMPIFIGADSNGGGSVPQNDFVIGSLDELRISNVVRPPQWLAYTPLAFRDQVITYP